MKQKKAIFPCSYYLPETAASLYITDNIVHACAENGLEVDLYTPTPTRSVPEGATWVREEEQIPYFDPFQMAQLARESSGTRIIVSHAPPCGMPGPQAGLENELHPPAGDFPETVKDISRRYRPALFLGAHNHMNLLVHRGATWLATVSAYPETPFEFKVVEIGEDGILHMKTVGLASAVGFRSDYDFGKTYIQGRPCDRSF